MRRVLIFSLTYHPFVGGAELAIKKITDRISASEYEFDMITLRFDKNLPEVERIGNITVYRIGMTTDAPKISDRHIPFTAKLAKICFPITSFLKARSLHKQHAYDIVWAMMANYAGFGALLFKYAYPRVPYFLELQDGNTLEQVKARQPLLLLLWPLYKRVYLKADFIKVISHFIEKLARNIGFSGPIAVIPNAVDVAKFSASVPRETEVELKSKFGKKLGDVFLFTASRLVLSRGVEDIIRALAFLPPHVKLLVAGTGDDQKKLEKIAHDVGVRNRVIFAGQVAHAALPAYYKISDIFVRPSIIEGFGSSFVEAFAAGIPIIATSVGGIPDFLFDPERNPDSPATGLFCEVGNPESIARAVRRYMKEPALVAEVVQNARALAEKKYDWNIIASDMRTYVFDRLTANVAKRMNITIAASIYPPEVGGPAQYAKNLKEALERAGHRVTLVRYGGLKKFPTGIRHLFYAVKLLINSRGADAIIAFDTYSGGLPAALVHALTGRPLLIRIGGDFVWELYVERTKDLVPLPDIYHHREKWNWKERAVFAVTRSVMRRASIIFSSRWLLDIWKDAYGIDLHRVHVIENAVGGKIEPVTSARKNFIFFTRQITLKNAAAFRRAFARARVTHPEIELDEGMVPHEELKQRMRECYAAVLPSISEVTPNYIINALRCGKPFLLTKYSGYAERFKDYGVIVDPLDEKDMTRGIIALATPEIYERLRSRVTGFKESHTYDDIALEFVDIARKNI